mgnify:CR=1 FL=1
MTSIREKWLTEVARLLTVEFKDEGLVPMPYRVTVGFPSARGLSKSRRVMGECWAAEASTDGTREIIISITVDDKDEAVGILAHELIHACFPIGVKHGRPFKQVARAIGLEGPLRSTTAGEEFIKRIQWIYEQVGSYPHAALNPNVRKKQSTRMLKVTCPCCGYTVRMSKKWALLALPACPVEECDNANQTMELCA